MFGDDLISKIRGNINNGFSIGMGKRDRLALADLANLQANIDPANASDILGRAADDIGFGARNNKYTLAAMNKLGNGVSGLDPMERLKMERAGVEGFATGGIIPGAVNPEPVDDTVIAAKQGEYVIPADIVQFLGQKTFDDMVVKARQRMTGQEGAPPRGAKKGYAQGGLVLDPEKRPEYTQPFTSLSDLMVNQERQKFIPNQEQIGVTIDNGSSVTPVYNPTSSKPSLGSPLSDVQADSLHRSWGIKPLDQLTAADKQYMANMPISIGATEGTYGNLADVTKRALADSVDKQNAGMGLIARDNPQAEAARLAFRSNIDKSGVLAENQAVKAEMARERSLSDLQRALAVQDARTQGQLAVQDARNQGLLAGIAARGAGGPNLRKGERLSASGEAELIPGSDLYIKNSRLHGKDVAAIKGLDTYTANAISKINSIVKSPSFSSLFGGYNAYLTNKMPGETQNVKTKLESLKSDLKKAGLEIMRSGGSVGMMTEREWPIVEQLIGTLDPKMSEKAAKDTLGQIQSYLGSIRKNASDTYDETWSGTQFYRNRGQGGSPPTNPKFDTSKPVNNGKMNGYRQPDGTIVDANGRRLK